MDFGANDVIYAQWMEEEAVLEVLPCYCLTLLARAHGRTEPRTLWKMHPEKQNL